jgi:hypothetical protein
MRNRVIPAILVGAGHVVVVLFIWAIRIPPVTKGVDQDVGIMVFNSAGRRERWADEPVGRPLLQSLHLRAPKADALDSLQFSSAITLLPPPSVSARAAASIPSDMIDAASDAIERARKEADRAPGHPHRDAAFEPLHQKPHDLDWITQHAHQVVDEHGVSQWVLVQPCIREALVAEPDCTIARVLPHGIMFEYIQEQRDARDQYGGPNAVP